MRRRDKAGRKATKTQRHKTLTRRNAPKSARRRESSVTGLNEKVALLTHERDELLQQQTTAEARSQRQDWADNHFTVDGDLCTGPLLLPGFPGILEES